MNIQRVCFVKMIAVCMMLILCVLTPEARGESYSALYDQVLDKLEQLAPGDTLVVNMGVEEERYQESFVISAQALEKLKQDGISAQALEKLAMIVDEQFSTQEEFTKRLESILGKDNAHHYMVQILNAAYAGKAVYQFGEQFELRFQASKESYIVLMHIAELKEDKGAKTFSGGDIVLLLPNQKFSEAKIEADLVYSTVENFGIDITAGEPPAVETINLFCSVEKLDWLKELSDNESYYVIAPTDEKRLQFLLENLELLKQSEWSGSSLKLQVGPQLGFLKRGQIRKFGAIPPIGATGTTGKFFPPIGATGTTGKR